MVKNKILDFIIQTIQWGIKKPGEDFFSEKALSIKFGVSHSTAKNALNAAEVMGLLISQKGKKRIVSDFRREVFLTRYLNIDLKKISVTRKKVENMNKNELNIFKNKFDFPKQKRMILEFRNEDEWISTFYSSTSNLKLFDTFFNKEKSFLAILREAKIIIKKIEKTTSIADDGSVEVKRILWSKSNSVIEEGYLIVNPKYYVRKRKTKYYLSDDK